ncbi:hypothetical protein ACGFNY_39495 [Streptomyces chartreusis]|uniref:hypothetical protein n=1 Tax=Streptomyces chartreusis TaxID=1969 RepID=UPI003724A575
MDSMTRDDLEGPEFQDTYTDALAQIIEANRGDKPLPPAPETEEAGGKVLDLMSALDESVAKAQAARDTGSADLREMQKKKTAAKKTTAKKQSAKKTPAKKASARRSRSAQVSHGLSMEAAWCCAASPADECGTDIFDDSRIVWWERQLKAECRAQRLWGASARPRSSSPET